MRHKLVRCPDSYWLRIEDYLTLARTIREEARQLRAMERADLENAADLWEDLARESLDFLTHLSREQTGLQR